MILKYTIIVFKYVSFILVSITISLSASATSSVEEIIKARKALFSKNYSTAKKVQIFVSKGESNLFI